MFTCSLLFFCVCVGGGGVLRLCWVKMVFTLDRCVCTCLLSVDQSVNQLGLRYRIAAR